MAGSEGRCLGTRLAGEHREDGGDEGISAEIQARAPTGA